MHEMDVHNERNKKHMGRISTCRHHLIGHVSLPFPVPLMGGYLVIILPFNFPRIFFNFAFLRNSSSFAHYVPAGVDPAENFLLGGVTDERSESLASKVCVAH